jgi:hypothetical protein
VEVEGKKNDTDTWVQGCWNTTDVEVNGKHDDTDTMVVGGKCPKPHKDHKDKHDDKDGYGKHEYQKDECGHQCDGKDGYKDHPEPVKHDSYGR